MEISAKNWISVGPKQNSPLKAQTMEKSEKFEKKKRSKYQQYIGLRDKIGNVSIGSLLS